MKNNTNSKSFIPNLKDYVKNNNNYQVESIKEYDKEMYENLLHTDIQNLKMPKYAYIECIALCMIILSIVFLILAFLIYFNVLDINTIVHSLKQCTM